ncbi:MAG TPA: DHH family phosphoesterase [Casimicrobiaceae bacterium]
MIHFDVFNGDADGICALHQLRLAAPVDSRLVTGAKRDVALLGRVGAGPGDSVSVLDISLAVNRAALLGLLERGVRIEYFDHHYAGDVPIHPGLTAVIDPAPGLCTGMLVDRHLGGRYRIWAVVAAFGDNLVREAHALAAGLPLSAAQLQSLRELGEALAYNGYGDSEADLIVHPATLYRTLRRYADPFDFIDAETVYRTIRDSRREDLRRALEIPPQAGPGRATVHILPDTPWSRRVRGALANELAQREPERAHAVLTVNAHGGYTVSVRAPLAAGVGADALCRKFATGGGRVAAAGINHLPQDELPRLARELEQAFP